jgi:hypothetical protein
MMAYHVPSAYRKLAFISFTLGALMLASEGAEPAAVPTLEFEFSWNGRPLAAGRTPLYGTERPFKDAQAGGGSRATELYRLSPFPLGYPAALGAEPADISVFLDPPLPTGAGKFHVVLRLSRSPVKLKDWVTYGLTGPAPVNPDSEAGEWSRKLAGKGPAEPHAILSRLDIRYGQKSETAPIVYRCECAPSEGNPAEIDIPMPELSADEERYRLDFGSFRFVWERRRQNPELAWPREKTAGPQAVPAEAESAPGRRKPWWRFWGKGE